MKLILTYLTVLSLSTAVANDTIGYKVVMECDFNDSKTLEIYDGSTDFVKITNKDKHIKNQVPKIIDTTDIYMNDNMLVIDSRSYQHPNGDGKYSIEINQNNQEGYLYKLPTYKVLAVLKNCENKD